MSELYPYPNEWDADELVAPEPGEPVVMRNYIRCPYPDCGHVHRDATDYPDGIHTDGLLLDWDCWGCGRTFRLSVSVDTTFSATAPGGEQ